MVTQRIGNHCIPVRFRALPPKIKVVLKLKESNLIGKIEDLERKNSLLTDNLDLDFIEILIREKFLFGKPVETTYIVKKDGKEFVKSKSGKLFLRGTPQADMIETRGGTQAKLAADSAPAETAR